MCKIYLSFLKHRYCIFFYLELSEAVQCIQVLSLMAKAEEKKNEPHTNIIDLEWCLYVRMFGGQSLKNS